MKSLLTYYNVKNNYYRYKLVDSYLWKTKSAGICNSYGELLVSITPLEKSNHNWLLVHLRRIKNKYNKRLIIRFE